MRKIAIAFAAAALWVGPAAAQETQRLSIDTTVYTKWLYGTNHYQGGLQNFEDAGGNWGDNGQGTELTLDLNAKASRQVSLHAIVQSRFNNNHWTNFGGFGSQETDPLSAQYVKFRGAQVVLTPGYGWIDSAVIGSNDWGTFDPFVIGKIRYIDRFNASGLLFSGSAMQRKLTWDLARISLPRLWAGPGYNTGTWHASDAAYAAQLKLAPSTQWDLAVLADYVEDQEVNPAPGVEFNPDHGQPLNMRAQNGVVGVRAGVRPRDWLDLKGALYLSHSNTFDRFAPASFDIHGAFSPMMAGRHDGNSWKIDANFIDPFGKGLNIAVQGFHVGKDYESVMAARRESDVLLTEGHDSTFALPGPTNASYGVYGGNPSKIGYAGWSGNAQQVATINVDNAFTDFDEPMAETCIGWQGITVVPTWGSGPLQLSGEYSFIGYDTNWQAFGHPERAWWNSTLYPTMETDAGIAHYRTAYAPFQDKTTHILVVNGKYTLDLAKGVDLFGKVKYIKEKDKRMNDARYLPYTAGGVAQDYSPGLSSSALYNDAPTVTVNGVTGPAWKPFRSLADDDRDMDYWSFNLGAGYQFFDELYLSLTYAKYLVDLKDGNTAFQAYGWQEFGSGKYDKNQIILKAKYVLAGVEFGMEGQYNFGTFKPDFGKECAFTGDTDCYVPQIASAVTGNGFAAGTRGFTTRGGGWTSLEDRTFENWRLKAFMKAQF
jgi:hypothetical protein